MTPAANTTVNKRMLNRRNFLEALVAAGLVSQLGWRSADTDEIAPSRAGAAAKRGPRILLRSSWQTVNIGDVAHTPGVLALIEEHIPDAEVQLWPSSIADGVEEMLRARFPNLTVIDRTAAGIRAAFAYNDFLLHGSGPYLVAADDVARWRAETGKPYGVYGITLGDPDQKTLDILNDAKFVFFRDTVSMNNALDKGLNQPVPTVRFGPDGAFATDLADTPAADAFLRANGLETGTFLCCIPRYRVTPYWEIYNREPTESEKASDAYNQRMKEQDHAPLRAAITAVVRQTDMKILICPEDRSQVRLGKEILLDKLPADVKPQVVWRDSFWSLDEARSTYLRSAGLFGHEMHSPIMCVGSEIPAVVCRWRQQTTKGFMWRDIGLGDWLFDMDDEGSRAGIAPAVLAIAKNPAAAKAKTQAALAYVRQRQRATMAKVAKEARLGIPA
ncbi:polysaccharide pyruvyl transferase family protein [Micromonospora endolithica]|nr:polysaccharide pyruvyl transferase family protein [Micromonospora endolithica]